MLIFFTSSMFFFFNDTATTEIYTLSLHDALPIWRQRELGSYRRLGERVEADAVGNRRDPRGADPQVATQLPGDRKSTRLNSSHDQISYAVFCLKKKKRSSRTLQRRHKQTTYAVPR